MSKNILQVNDKEMANLLRHPLRYTILFTISDLNEPVTVQMVADKLDMKHGNVFYHMKKLLEAGVIKLSRTEVLNSFITKYYELAVDDIYFTKESLKSVNVSYLAECNNLIFNRAINNFVEAVYPKDLGYDVTDAINDWIVTTTYYLDPEDIGKISGEIKEVFKKYQKTTEEGTRYSIISGAGKFRSKKKSFYRETGK